MDSKFSSSLILAFLGACALPIGCVGQDTESLSPDGEVPSGDADTPSQDSEAPSHGSELPFIGVDGAPVEQISVADLTAIRSQIIVKTPNLVVLAHDAESVLTPLQYDFALQAIERTNWIANSNAGWHYDLNGGGEMVSDEEGAPANAIWCGNVVQSIGWITRDGVVSDSISPTACGAWGANGLNNWDGWVEVVAKTPSNSAWNKTYGTSKYWSMYDQFVCHFFFVQGWKTPWNLEPSRPNVGLASTVAAGCNP